MVLTSLPPVCWVIWVRWITARPVPYALFITAATITESVIVTVTVTEIMAWLSPALSTITIIEILLVLCAWRIYTATPL